MRWSQPDAVPGDRVAAQVDKHWHVLALYLGCLRAGLVYLPLNTGYQRSELGYFFGDAQPRVVVCNADHLGVIATLARHATVLTLDELFDRALYLPGAVRHRHLAARRSRGHSVHVGNHRPVEGSDADASQSRVQRACAGGRVGLHARRRAPARAADLSRARALRGHALRAAVGVAHAVVAEIRRAGGRVAAAAGDRHDGRTHVLYAAARRT